MPLDIGDWKGTASELPPEERAMAGATACLARQYFNPSTGTAVTVLLLGGGPGKISTHTPDVCYASAGYSLAPPTRFQRTYGLKDQRATFRTALATRGGTNPSVLQIIWSWNASKGWSAPDEPRWEFANAQALCKLYVVRETRGEVADPGSDPCNDFLTVFLPELDQRVFSAVK